MKKLFATLALLLVSIGVHAQTVVTFGANTGNTSTALTNNHLVNIFAGSVDTNPETMNIVTEEGPVYARTAVFKADVQSIIPSNATVTAASLNLYETFSWDNPTIYVHRVLRPIVPAQVSFTDYATSTPWATGGGVGSGDIDSTPLVTLVSTGAVAYEAFTSAGLISLVQSWVDGSVTNNGLLVRVGASEYTPAGSAGTDATRPYFSVTYTVAAGSSLPVIRQQHEY